MKKQDIAGYLTIGFWSTGYIVEAQDDWVLCINEKKNNAEICKINFIDTENEDYQDAIFIFEGREYNLSEIFRNKDIIEISDELSDKIDNLLNL